MEEYRKIFNNRVNSARDAESDDLSEVTMVKAMIRECGAQLIDSKKDQDLSVADKTFLMNCFTKLGHSIDRYQK